MSVTSGFFVSLNHDRVYDATQLSSIFDGVISDGVYESYGGGLRVDPSTGMNVVVRSGRAWFNHTWTLSNADMALAIDAAEAVLNRIDAVVLEVNSESATRANSIKVVKGTPASTAVRPTLTNTETVHQYALAYITIAAGTTAITSAMITDIRGTDACPFVSGVVNTITDISVPASWASTTYQSVACYYTDITVPGVSTSQRPLLHTITPPNTIVSKADIIEYRKDATKIFGYEVPAANTVRLYAYENITHALVARFTNV